MTIKNLNTLLRDKTNAIHTIPLYRFRNWRIALDISQWLIANKAVIHKTYVKYMDDIVDQEIDQTEITKRLYSNFMSYINRFLAHGVTLVPIFDGKPPVKKDKVRTERRSKKAARREEAELLRETLQNTAPHLRSNADIDKLRSLLEYDYSIDKNDFTNLEIILTAVGIPWIKGDCEAERLCSALSRRNRVAAVISTDTDNVAHQCPFWINKLEHNIFDPDSGQNVTMVTIIIYNEILRDLKLTPEQLTDICIISGCDYNENIPRFSGKTAYNAIIKYGSYYNLPADKKQDCIDYEYCKDQFALIDFPEMTTCDTWRLNINPIALQTARSVLEQFNIENWIEDLLHYYSHMLSAYDGYVFNPFPARIQLITNNDQGGKNIFPKIKPNITPSRKNANIQKIEASQVINISDNALDELEAQFSSVNISDTKGEYNETSDLENFMMS